jgi:hypothetical protein
MWVFSLMALEFTRCVKPNRHSREGGNLARLPFVLGLARADSTRSVWIPAFAGMTKQ